VEGIWYKESPPGRWFIIKIPPGESLGGRLVEFARTAGVTQAVIVSGIGSVKDIRFRGIKTGAKLPITTPRMHRHDVEGPLELLGLAGNIFPSDRGEIDCHLHITGGLSSGEVIGGHLYEAAVFATCEIVLVEFLAEGIERHQSKSGGIPTVYIRQG
jgi:predicted DNA-binding protein with PD1-like motif